MTFPNKENDERREECIWNPTLEQIELVESWSQGDLDLSDSDCALWAAHIAAVLVRLGSKNIPRKDVEMRTRRAVEMDPDNWMASHLLAKVVESDEEAVEILIRITDGLSKDEDWNSSEKHKKLLAGMLLDLGDKYWGSGEKLEDLEKAVNAYQRSIDKDRTFCSRHLDVVNKYAERALWQPLATFLEGMHNVPTGVPSGAAQLLYAGLNKTNISFRNNILRAFQAVDRLDVMRNLYDVAAATARFYWQSFVVAYYYGGALIGQPQFEDAGLAVWETFLERKPAPNEEHLAQDVIVKLGQLIVPQWTTRAFTKGVEPQKAAAYATKIEALYARFSDQYTRNSHLSLSFARYFFRKGDVLMAKRAVREVAIQALEMMSDDDPDNDYQSFWQIGMVLSTLEDQKNALAAWDMMTIANDEKQSKDAKNKEELRTGGKSLYNAVARNEKSAEI